MRAIISQSILNVFVFFKPAVIIFVLVFVFFMGSLIVVRQQCIRQGYEISSLTSAMDVKSLEYERLSSEYSNSVRKEILMNKAIELDFVFPSGGKVYYVQR